MNNIVSYTLTAQRLEIKNDGEGMRKVDMSEPRLENCSSAPTTGALRCATCDRSWSNYYHSDVSENEKLISIERGAASQEIVVEPSHIHELTFRLYRTFAPLDERSQACFAWI